MYGSEAYYASAEKSPYSSLWKHPKWMPTQVQEWADFFQQKMRDNATPSPRLSSDHLFTDPIQSATSTPNQTSRSPTPMSDSNKANTRSRKRKRDGRDTAGRRHPAARPAHTQQTLVTNQNMNSSSDLFEQSSGGTPTTPAFQALQPAGSLCQTIPSIEHGSSQGPPDVMTELKQIRKEMQDLTANIVTCAEMCSEAYGIVASAHLPDINARLDLVLEYLRTLRNRQHDEDVRRLSLLGNIHGNADRRA